VEHRKAGDVLQAMELTRARPSLTRLRDVLSGKTRPAATSSPSECPDCKGKGFVRVDVPLGHELFGKALRCTNPAHEPQWKARLAARSGLNPEDLSVRLADIGEVHHHDGEVSNRAMLEASRAFVADPFGFLYVWGDWGNAKSEALIAIVNELNAKGAGTIAMYIKFSKLVEYMREAFADRKRRDANPDADMSYQRRFEEIRAIPALAIDEFDFAAGKVRLTEFVEEFRFDFLDDRYRDAITGRTATVFASNSPPESLPEPIYDRIRDGRFKIVRNTAPSSRPAMRREQGR
jgi:DNA replication protein DnaC